MKSLQALLEPAMISNYRVQSSTRSRSTMRQSATFSGAMANRGYEIAIDADANAVRCIKRDTIDPFKITEMRTALTTLAEEFGGSAAG